MTKNALLKRGPKNSGMGRPPPPYSGNARKKTFFFIDVFPYSKSICVIALIRPCTSILRSTIKMQSQAFKTPLFLTSYETSDTRPRILSWHYGHLAMVRENMAMMTLMWVLIADTQKYFPQSNFQISLKTNICLMTKSNIFL